uniref:Uncharacterized mitochondrial protein ymf26 n=1 Tax=Marchantia polymorpha TaxID=3197 RepID=YMF26_MARPO|nr:hypothetical protein MapooMp05 [Marchantia paleacea]P38468.1 RecName: Full=Uncharacterized mitochondrial protein ymf26; AltName: Full=ORF63 [Marchantia polymorpha]AAC09400.1 ORF63; putative [Marchantia paleacea]
MDENRQVRFFQPFKKMFQTSQTSSVTGWIGSCVGGTSVSLLRLDGPKRPCVYPSIFIAVWKTK